MMVVLMSVREAFKRGQAKARAARAGLPMPDGLPAGGPSPIRFGYYCGLNSEQPSGPNLYYGERHIALFGLNGSGKSTRSLIELLMTSVGRSIFVFDIKGELAFQTADERRRFSDV